MLERVGLLPDRDEDVLQDLLGTVVPDDRPIDGTSLVPLLEGGAIRRERPLFWFFYRTSPAAALRDGDWVIVGYPESRVPKGHALTAEQQAWLAVTGLDRFELFNVREDVSQGRDLAADHPQRLASMRRRLVETHAEVVAEGYRWEFAR